MYDYLDIVALTRRFNTPERGKKLLKALSGGKCETVHLQGLQGSAAAVLLSSLAGTEGKYVIVANDAEEAGYMYHDLTQICGEKGGLFFPSGYKRAVKYGQIDTANVILRTEALNRLADADKGVIVVLAREGIAEKVVTDKTRKGKTVGIGRGEQIESTAVADKLFELGFERTDYVYEPGQYSVRGRIIDVYSFSGSYSYRIDFFGNEIDSVSNFDLESQLSIKQV